MDSGYRKENVEGTGTSRPTAARHFAQAVLGESFTSFSRTGADARAGRERLTRLAEIAPRQGSPSGTCLLEQERATVDRARLEWLAGISEAHESQLRRLMTDEAEVREVEARVEQLAEYWNVREAVWDPAKHPRRGGPPNAG